MYASVRKEKVLKMRCLSKCMLLGGKGREETWYGVCWHEILKSGSSGPRRQGHTGQGKGAVNGSLRIAFYAM